MVLEKTNELVNRYVGGSSSRANSHHEGVNMISLKASSNWLVAVVLIATLLINLLVQLLHAGPRIRAEAGSNLRLTREFVLKSIANIPETDNPVAALQSLFANLGDLRHVEIKILGPNDPTPGYWWELNHDRYHDLPEWFVKVAGAAPRVIVIPLVRGTHDYGRVAIVSNPLDELEEIWGDMTWLASISVVATLTIMIAVIFLIRFALSPFNALQAGLAELEAGRSGVKILVRGASEFRNISNALNSLAATLDLVRNENKRLMSELIEVQDNERKEIGRDLHDEAGPCLFSIRAAVTALQDSISQGVLDRDRMAHLSSIIDRSSTTLQLLFRGLLDRLRPKGLAELGLEPALRSLFANWELSHPEVALRLVLPHDLSSLDEDTAFTAYRIVQEGVTNIFRHAHADWGEVKLSFALGPIDAKQDADQDSVPQLEIAIEDNGVGVPEKPKTGMGLLGMRERVHALGGTFKVEKRSAGGTLVRALIPLVEDDEEE